MQTIQVPFQPRAAGANLPPIEIDQEKRMIFPNKNIMCVEIGMKNIAAMESRNKRAEIAPFVSGQG